MKATVFPIVNLNGDTAQTLYDQNYHARKAVRDAMKLLKATAPHGRNYQCNPVGEYEQARADFEQMYKQLDDMTEYLMDVALYVHDHNPNQVK